MVKLAMGLPSFRPYATLLPPYVEGHRTRTPANLCGLSLV
jgi:hypothetical protein